MADQPQVSPAFAKVPVNPNVQPEQTQAPAPAPTPAPVPNPVPEQTPQFTQPQDKLQSWLNILNNTEQPQPEPAPQPAPMPAPQPAPIPAPAPAPAPAPQQTQMPQQNVQEFMTLQQQNQQLQAQLAQQQQVIQNLMDANKGYNDLKVQTAADNIQFGELGTVDADDAKAIAAGIMKALDTQLAPIKEALAQQRSYSEHVSQMQDQKFAQQQAKAVINQIMQKHPDFIELQTDPNYLRFVQQHDGSSSLTYDAIAAYEFQRGNANYIIDLVNKYKQQQPASSAITSVAPVQTAAIPQPAQEQQVELPTLRELNQWMQMRRINQDQYRQLLQKIMASQKG